VIEHYS